MASSTVKEGYVCKSPPDDKSTVKSWRNRWLVLRLEAGRPQLEYYEERDRKRLKGTIPLEGVREVVKVTNYPRYPHVFALTTPKRKFLIAAPSPTELNAWIESLQRTLNATLMEEDAKTGLRTLLPASSSATPSASPSAPPAPSAPPPLPPPPVASPIATPIATKLPLPAGWEERRDQAGKSYFVNHMTKTTQYEDPRSQLAPVAQPQAVSPGYAPMMAPGYAPYSPASACQRPQMPPPNYLLPPGWEQRRDPSGRPYFVNHQTQMTQFEDPRILPSGWEQRVDPQGKAYFLNHNTRQSTYDDPRLKPRSGSSVSSDGSAKSGNEAMSTSHAQMKEKLLKFQIRPSSLDFQKKIGEGAFGDVWLCKAKNLESDLVAVKLMRDYKDVDEKQLVDFLQEGVVMAQFNHPRVIKLLGVSISKTPYLLISEYMNRGDLKNVLQGMRLAGDVASLKLRLTCALQAAEGLLYLSTEKAFVHRDVAARNVLVHEVSPDEWICKMTDFGLSRDVYESEYYRHQTGDTKALLPVKWMALESLQDHIYTHKSDVWGFGVLLWEVLAMGMMPYPGVDNRIIWQELRDGLQLSDKPLNDCPGPIYDLILRCTDHSPNRRPDFDKICARLNEEIMVCVGDDHDYYNVPVGTQYENVTLKEFARKTSSLKTRHSLQKITSINAISQLPREEMEDVLHANFVAFDSKMTTDQLAETLRELWKGRRTHVK